jgi:hypothetical protein
MENSFLPGLGLFLPLFLLNGFLSGEIIKPLVGLPFLSGLHSNFLTGLLLGLLSALLSHDLRTISFIVCSKSLKLITPSRSLSASSMSSSQSYPSIFLAPYFLEELNTYSKSCFETWPSLLASIIWKAFLISVLLTRAFLFKQAEINS